ncbi:SCO3374 family protein [Streptomyces sp. NPDC046805]|uniref:SCO3374 family protein n=1 Tax=Streptomyces sp. NPDC046805 TaxID=3155134 RepID=UPI0033E67D1D
MVGSVSTTPLPRLPRRPPGPGGPGGTAGPEFPGRPVARIRRWYENELGWTTVPGEPLRLVTGLRFDVLDVPAEAGTAALRHLTGASPVALRGDRMLILVAAGSAEELPGLLDWLEWGALALDLTALGADGRMAAPLPPEPPGLPGQSSPGTRPPRSPRPAQGAAVWLRPPEPGYEVEASLPTLSAVGGVGGAPDLVRLVDTVATGCHRIRLRRACARPPLSQPLAFS